MSVALAGSGYRWHVSVWFTSLDITRSSRYYVSAHGEDTVYLRSFCI